MRSHVEMQTRENIESGMKPDEAPCAANLIGSGSINWGYLEFLRIEPNLAIKGAEFTDEFNLAVFFDLEFIRERTPFRATGQLADGTPAGNSQSRAGSLICRLNTSHPQLAIKSISTRLELQKGVP